MIKSNRVFRANDHLDILRLAVALQHADALACDTAMKEVIRQTKLDVAVTVFSMREMEKLSNWVSTL